MQSLGLVILLLALISCTEAARFRNNQSLMGWLRSMRAKRQDNSLTSERVWSLVDAIPGVPDTDYPIFSEIPETDFSCDGRSEGYYADIAARCQVFRVCANTANNTSKGFGFLCPNGTLFNQEFFVCDWYRNVICENSENFYGLNDLIGKPMSSFSNKEVMNSAREIIMFPKQTSNFNPSMNGAMYDNYPSQLGSMLEIPGTSGVPSRGSLNLGQPTAGGGKPNQATTGSDDFTSSKTNFGPLAPSGVLPQRGANGGTVYVNSLGQLSTDDDSGFDPKRSFILRPDKDSTFDQDIPIPSSSFDSLKGIPSYSFGFPGNNDASLRGSADLSEPVDPSEYYNTNDRYLPPTNRKQIYTYPHDAQPQGFNSLQPILPIHTGQINMKLAAQSPKYEAPQVYGPAASQAPVSPQNIYEPQRKSVQDSFQPGTASQQQQQLLQDRTVDKQNNPTMFSQQRQNFQPQSQQSSPQNQQQQIERRNDNYPQNNILLNQGLNPEIYRSLPSKNYQIHRDYLRNFLKDKTHIHHDNKQLVELIQRLFVPPSTMQRVVSADVHSSEGDSFDFKYDGDVEEPASSNLQNNYQLNHQHSAPCSHQG